MNTFEKYCSYPQGRRIIEKWNYLEPEDTVGCPLCDSKEATLWYKLGNTNTLKCRRCCFKYVSPRLSKKQLLKYYKNINNNGLFMKDFELRKHDHFNDPVERKNKIRDRHFEIETTNKFTNCARILDIGCGTGFYFEGLIGNHELHGIELSQKAVAYTRKRFNALIHECDIDDAIFKEDYFDVINMTYVIEHLLDPVQIMKNIYKWLRPGGLLLVSSPNWSAIVSRIYREFFRLNDPCQHINIFERKSLDDFLSKSGFSVEKVYYPYFKTEYFNKYEIIRLFRNTLIKITLPLSIMMGYIPDPEKILSPPFWGNVMVVEAYKGE